MKWGPSLRGPPIPQFTAGLARSLLRLPANGIISESMTNDGMRVVQISSVKDYRAAHQAVHDPEIRIAEFLPLGHDGQSIRAFQRTIGAIAIGDLVADQFPGVGHGLGVVNAQDRAGGEKLVYEHQGGGLPNIV